MAENQNDTNLVTRIVESHAPCSVVIEDNKIDLYRFVDKFLSDNDEKFKAASILPVRIDCSQINDKIHFWKRIAEQIRLAVPGDFEWDDDADEEWETIESSQNTFFLKESIVTIAKLYFEMTGWYFLLVFEGFEFALEIMDMEDSLKVRDLTRTFVMLTVTHKSLKVLGEGNVNNFYYCNQFETFRESFL